MRFLLIMVMVFVMTLRRVLLLAIAGPMAYAYYKKMPDALVYQAMKKLPDWMVKVNERYCFGELGGIV